MVVRTVAVRDTELAVPVVASGLLTTDEEVPLAFKVGGVIERLSVQEGQAVRAGQTLATLEQPEISALVDKAQAGLDKAERDLKRARALFADSVISREMLDDAETARNVAAADVRAARFNQRYASIIAPASGIILRRMAEPGQMAAPGQAMLLFGRAGRGQQVRVGLADRDAARVAPGDAADVRFDAYPGRTFRGRLERVGAAAAPGTGTYEAVIRLDERVSLGAASLASGLVADVHIHTARAQRVRVVPLEALLEGDGDRGVVWSPSPGGGVTRRVVRLASFDAERVAVREGLEGVDRVITDGAAYLSESSRVRNADDTPAAPQVPAGRPDARGK